MEKIVLIIFIIVFLLIIFAIQYKKARIDRKFIIATSFPLLLLILYVTNYKLFEDIPIHLDAIIMLFIIGVLLAFILLKEKVDFNSLMIIIGFSIQTIGVVSFWILMQSYPVLSTYIAIILLSLGTLLFVLAICFKIVKFLKQK